MLRLRLSAGMFHDPLTLGVLTMWATIASMFAMFTRAFNVVDTNLQSLEKLSNAGLSRATQFEQEQQYDLDMRKIALEAKKQKLLAK